MDYFIGHLIGDYLLQNDWQAMNKKSMSLKGWITCSIHSILYTLAVCLCTSWWRWYLILLVFLSHFPIDKTYIVAKYMRLVGAFKRVIDDPAVDMNHKVWAYLFVDNTVHLTLLWLIARYAA